MYDETVHPTKKATGAPAGVTAEGLGKRFGDLWALRDLDLAVPAGTVLGLLGHNGAGKTTAIRILTTLSVPTTGQATVAGHDVVGEAAAVRRRIGVAAQQATVDGLLTARANLEMVGRLYHLPRLTARRRADELLGMVDLADTGGRLVKTFSGGMRRRLDLAAALVAQPQVLFLDEPTTGLDPRSRGELWDLLRGFVREGSTVVLTTQYLDEADKLADDVVVLDHGRVIAQGTPDQLKSRIGQDRVEVTLQARSDVPGALAALERFATQAATADDERPVVVVPVREGVRLMDVMRALDDAGIDALDLNRRQATLDDVFLTLTDRQFDPVDEVPA